MPRTQAAHRNRVAKAGEVPCTPLSPERFAGAVSAVLMPIADPELRPWMRAYMKNQFEFLGIKTPDRRAAVADLIRSQKSASAADLLRSARLLWALPEREYQFVAVDLLGSHVRTLTPRQLPALLALIRKKSWWDTVDSLAGVIGRVVLNARTDEADIQCEMDKALQPPNLWVRRVAILHQLGWRNQTDAQRLFTYALSSAHEKDFFIRKAIGWALRDYARCAPGEVRAFVHKNRGRLSPLTAREAMKHL
jgi:3-methyladenine DNA glycosylase AlkD